MSYATLDDMVKRYRRSSLDALTSDKTDLGEPDDSLVEQALQDARALIDSYISPRYPLPLSVVPAALTRVCCDIAFYYLCDAQATEQCTQRYKDAVKWLHDVLNEKLPLGTDAHGAEPVSENLVEVKSDTAVFSRNQRGFI
ncbi:DUF1320 family protein [Yersinia enterocolitica]|nr:DUF1320 family protein [Yersinia enterocolitica]EKN5119434.1 DUF1320 domain-containing protein [Yersinia enterocolitica]EKN5955683.1 DUF1320 domain-containing protein [Yersinia enterocolitica]